MTLENHIAMRFLTDDALWFEIMESTYPDEVKFYLKEEQAAGDSPEKLKSLYHLCMNTDQKAYFISSTVLEKLEMLKLNKKGAHYDWSVFADIPQVKTTYVFPDNGLLRMQVYDDMIAFIHVNFEYHDKKKGIGEMKWVMFYLNRKTGELCEHFEHDDVKGVETFFYSLLCFMFLTENDEIVVPPRVKYGTKRDPNRLRNDLPFPITIVSSRWNTEVCRTEKFGVRGHFRIQRVGAKRNDYKLIFIAPFEKNGYTRRAQKEWVTSGEH